MIRPVGFHCLAKQAAAGQGLATMLGSVYVSELWIQDSGFDRDALCVSSQKPGKSEAARYRVFFFAPIWRLV